MKGVINLNDNTVSRVFFKSILTMFFRTFEVWFALNWTIVFAFGFVQYDPNPNSWCKICGTNIGYNTMSVFVSMKQFLSDFRHLFTFASFL